MRINITKITIVGFLLPYVVGILPNILFHEKIRSQDFHVHSNYDCVTSWLIISAFVLGWLLCVPWFITRLKKEKSKILFVLFTVVLLAVQIITVAIASFFIYYELLGGAFP